LDKSKQMRTNEDILQERARKISGKLGENQEVPVDEMTLVEFNLISGHYAIEESFVLEVLLLKELTPIPGVPAFVAGIINLRGKIISVVNLKLFLGIPGKGITDMNRIIVLKNDLMEFGILADSILGTKTIQLSKLLPAPITVQAVAAGYVKGISSEGLIVLDGFKILAAKSIVVNQKLK